LYVIEEDFLCEITHSLDTFDQRCDFVSLELAFFE
jgi:hypothetical protein